MKRMRLAYLIFVPLSYQRFYTEEGRNLRQQILGVKYYPKDMRRNYTSCVEITHCLLELHTAACRNIHCEKYCTGQEKITPALLVVLVTNMRYGVWPVKLEWKVVIHINILVLSNSIAASDCHFRRHCKFLSQQPYVLLLLLLNNVLATLWTVSHHQNWQINKTIFKWPLFYLCLG